MRKTFWVVWILDTAALIWLFGYIVLYGSTPDRTELAGNLGMIWGGLAGVGGWALFKEKRKAKQEKEKAAAAR